MKKLLLFLLFSTYSFAQESNDYRVIPSLTDWIEEINNWPDSLYKVSKVRVIIDFEKDSLLYGPQWDVGHDPSKVITTVNKPVNVEDFYIEGFFSGKSVAIKNIRFKEEVRLKNYRVRMISFNNVIFDKDLYISDSEDYVYYNSISCHYKDGLGFYDFAGASRINLRDAKVDRRLFFVRATGSVDFEINKGKFNEIAIGEEQLARLRIENASIVNLQLQGIRIESLAHLIDNEIEEINLAGAQLPEANTFMGFEQISQKIYSSTDYGRFKYVVSDSMDFDLKYHYDLLIGSYKILQDRYQNIGDRDSYNASYIEMKNIETQRLAYLFGKDPSFKSFFTWKINQFLKVFSAYGTEPARAIIYSMYVILIFALVYLFFPNSWDSHGKNRIIDRYNFFFKYMKLKTGVHEVYLDDQKEELMSYEQFKENINNSNQKVPRFFTATALPLYKWAISGTQFSASILKRIDIMKGSWSELPKSKRIWKSILLIGAFLIAVIYDIFIKTLNALMLSINTFTTLGFGEIPIKGLPRYLAIIQGFIGWFMLTIFSVSLISQLLN